MSGRVMAGKNEHTRRVPQRSLVTIGNMNGTLCPRLNRLGSPVRVWSELPLNALPQTPQHATLVVGAGHSTAAMASAFFGDPPSTDDTVPVRFSVTRVGGPLVTVSVPSIPRPPNPEVLARKWAFAPALDEAGAVSLMLSEMYANTVERERVWGLALDVWRHVSVTVAAAMRELRRRLCCQPDDHAPQLCAFIVQLWLCTQELVRLLDVAQTWHNRLGLDSSPVLTHLVLGHAGSLGVMCKRDGCKPGGGVVCW